MKGDEYNMKQGKCFIICILMCGIIFCSCNKEGVNTREKKNETVQETKEEVVIEETAESIEQEEVVNFEPEKGYDLPVPDQDRVEAVITHELTVRFAEDGSFQYLGNKILNGGIKDIPEYQYRIVDKK